MTGTWLTDDMRVAGESVRDVDGVGTLRVECPPRFVGDAYVRDRDPRTRRERTRIVKEALADGVSLLPR